MRTISLKLDDAIFGDTEKIVSVMKTPRNRYINEAIDHYNKLQKRKFLAQKLASESALVQDNSLEVLREFEEIDDED